MQIEQNFATITFLGASGTVTGSKYLLSVFNTNILIDCGLFQGLKPLRLLNWDALPTDVNKIDLVLLTHAHLDHCGFLPRLVKSGYNKPIIGTKPTLEVAGIILTDSAKIQLEDANLANQNKFSKHHPALPLYIQDDVDKTVALFVSKSLDEWNNVNDHIAYRFRYAGHIIGATFIELKIDNTIFVFSGDIGRQHDQLLNAPLKPNKADVLLIESTYGNSTHRDTDQKKVAQIINHTAKVNGTVIIPGFAVERAQLLMYYLMQLKQKNEIADLPVYLDSPMASAVIKVIRDNMEWMKISKETFDTMINEIRIIEEYSETIKLCANKSSKIIIAASGMATGGRVLTYFEAYLGGKENTILLAGYQAPGTRGRQLIEGKKKIKFYGKQHIVRAHIASIEGLSAHADQPELIDWLSDIKPKPQNIFIVHGEQEPAIGLKTKIKKVYNWESQIAQLDQSVTIKIQ